MLSSTTTDPAGNGDSFGKSELVSVVIPAFNACDYIDRTLLSVRRQTHKSLEILVVDDGSTDGTASIVCQHALQDGRVRLIQQDNSGVAVARNRGIEEARGRYIAPIDADDLWAPDKVELQLRAAVGQGEPAGLVYSWYVLIDEHDWIVQRYNRLPDGSDILRHMCRNNVVGSGSSPLLLRSAIIEAGGYDPTLRDRKAQGCEDYKLYFAIMERHPVKLVRAYLTGYRVADGNMSSDSDQMLRSRHIVTGEIIERHPDFRRELERGHVRAMRFMVARSVRSGNSKQMRVVLGRMFQLNLRAAMLESSVLVARGALSAVRALGRSVGIGLRSQFAIGEPARREGGPPVQ